MAYVITENCVKDLLCVDECVMGAIHPAEDKAATGTVPPLYINPDECVQCGACVSVCVSDAIHFTNDRAGGK